MTGYTNPSESPYDRLLATPVGSVLASAWPKRAIWPGGT